MVARFEHSAYGEEIFTSASSALTNFPYRFVGALGCRTDAATGLIYMRERWYDSGLARFISRDPLRSANRYAYCKNSPVNRIDPSGLKSSRLDRDYHEPNKGAGAGILHFEIHAECVCNGDDDVIRFHVNYPEFWIDSAARDSGHNPRFSPPPKGWQAPKAPDFEDIFASTADPVIKSNAIKNLQTDWLKKHPGHSDQAELYPLDYPEVEGLLEDPISTAPVYYKCLCWDACNKKSYNGRVTYSSYRVRRPGLG